MALHLRSGLAVALATDPDGEANEAKLVPDLLPQVQAACGGRRLWLADRQFCDLVQTAAFTAGRATTSWSATTAKVHFYPDPARPVQPGRTPGPRLRAGVGLAGAGAGQAAPLRAAHDAAPGRGGRRGPGHGPAGRGGYPAEDLLALYLARWGIERVFQQITEVFHLKRLIARTPQGTLFQLSFCLLLYNRSRWCGLCGRGGQQRPVAR